MATTELELHYDRYGRRTFVATPVNTLPDPQWVIIYNLRGTTSTPHLVIDGKTLCGLAAQDTQSANGYWEVSKCSKCKTSFQRKSFR